MGLVDLSLFALYLTALLFSVIELGLSGYIVDVTSNSYYSTNSRYAFALFCSIWTLLVAGFLVAFPFLSRRGGNSIQSSHHERWMAPVTITLNALTFIFWLACFSSLADMYFRSPRGVAGAQLAFAVMLW